jgi:two-component system, OmpR family, response regulator
MGTARRVLVVDDDPHIREVVGFALSKAGFDTAFAEDGVQALERVAALDPDLVVLDVLMPELDGTEVCKRIRAERATPIVFLSSRDDEIDRILGLELGGDDYVTKPFSPRELVARVRAVLRRAEAMAVAPSAREPAPRARTLSHGELHLDLDRFVATWKDQIVTFTVTEFGIVRTLMGFPGKVYTRDELSDGAYGGDNIVSDRTIDSHVRRVRQKLRAAGADPVETVHGLGYRLRELR